MFFSFNISGLSFGFNSLLHKLQAACLTCFQWTVFNQNRVVGNTSNLAASCMLVHLKICVDGSQTSSDSNVGDPWYFYMDIDGIHSPSLPFSYQNKELLVCLSLSWIPRIEFCSTELGFIIVIEFSALIL